MPKLRAPKNRHGWLLVSCCWLVMAAALWAAVPEKPAAPVSEENSPQVARLEKALRENVTWEYLDDPLADVVKKIEKQCHIPVLLDLKALEEAAIAVDVLINDEARQIPLESALTLMLQRLDLTFLIHHDSLVITTQRATENIEQYGSTKVYPVLDLVKRRSPLVLDLIDLDEDYRGLIATICDTVMRESWSEVGGNASIKASPAQGALVILQTWKAHREIQKLLARLRHVHDLQFELRPGSIGEPDSEGMVLRIYRVRNGPFVKVWSEPSNSMPMGMVEKKGEPRWLDRPSAEELAKLIPQVIEPSSWAAARGPGAIQAVSGALIIRQSPASHQKVQELLNAVYAIR